MAIINFVFCLLLFLFIGIGLGLIGTVLFFRMDKHWKQILISVFTTMSTGGAGIAFISFLKVNEDCRSLMLFVACVGLGLSVYFTFKKLCTLLKEQSEKNTIRILDIVLGYDEFLKNYYESRKKVVDNEIQKEWHSYEEKNRQLEEQEEKIKAKEKYLRNTEEQIIAQSEKHLALNLPVKQVYIPTIDFLKMIPPSVSGYNVFVSSINKLTNEFLKKFSSIDELKSNNNIFKSYLAGVGMYIANNLFGTARRDIRTHFRISDGVNHNKYTVIYHDGPSEDSLSLIPCGNSLIEESYKAKRAIVASLNSEYTYNTQSGSGWEDFMTYSFQCASKDNKPFLSMAISIKEKNDYKTMLCFFNYCEIELIIEAAIKKIIDSKCDIIQMLENSSVKENYENEVSSV